MEPQKHKNRLAVIDGWFTMDPDNPRLIGNRCKVCGDYYFPKAMSCRNPDCMQDDLEEVLLGTKGKLWSYTNNHYPPPPPDGSPDPFVPYALVVTELYEEKLMVMGQLAKGYDFTALKEGMEMELVVEPLHVDDEGNEHLIWKWKPAHSETVAEGSRQ